MSLIEPPPSYNKEFDDSWIQWLEKVYRQISEVINLPTELTISSGEITANKIYHAVDTEGDAATDDLDTINYVKGCPKLLILRAASNARTIVCKDSTDNLRLAGDFSLTHSHDTLTLSYNEDTVRWYEVSRSNNAA